MRNFSLKHSLLCLAKYRLYMPLRQYQTLPLLSRVCSANSTFWILFCRVKIYKYYSFMNNFFKQFRHENHPVNAGFLTNLFIRTNKDPKFCHIWTLCRNFIKILKAFRQCSPLNVNFKRN